MSAPERPSGRDQGTDPASRAVPGTAVEWTQVLGRISGLLLALAATESSGHRMPAPVSGREALRAWGRLTIPVSAAVRAYPDAVDTRVAVGVPTGDVDVLGACARELGRVLCRFRGHGSVGAVAATLLREARVHGGPPEHLVAQFARVHGVLDVGSMHPDRRVDVAGAIWRAGA